MINDTVSSGSDGTMSWVIDFFRPEDAAGVVELYRTVYGENYPVRDVYEPDKIIRQGETGEAYRVVARTSGQEVVGHIAFYRSSPPNRNLYEQGQMMVRHDYRTSDMARQLFEYSLAEVPRRYNLEQVWGEAVCNHLVTQQMTAGGGFYPAALEVALMPAEAYAKAFSRPLDSCGRVATLVVFRTFKAKPQTVYIPKVYEEALRFIYSAYDFGHNFLVSGKGLAADAATQGQVDIFAAAGVARITLLAAGGDFAAYMIKAEQQAIAKGAVVIQVYLPLSWPWAGAVTDILRQQGYFLGGPLPRWFDVDGLLMQKVLTEPHFDGIHLFRKQARSIFEIIKKDWLASR